MRRIAFLSSLLLLTLTPPPQAAQPPSDLKSRAERTNFEETSRYDDVVQFFGELAKRSNLVRNDSFGTTQEGRKMPLVIIADPPITKPSEARASGKSIIFVLANIHAGEVEGKEAMQHFARRVALGDLKPLLQKLVILIAPIYNADGNERINVNSRTAQNGPIAGVGARPNAQGQDLNRDYTKLSSPEAKAQVRLLSEWDPHLTMDLHTTNGSYHAYHLTYSIPLNPMTDPNLLSYHRDKMMPVIAKAMLDKHQFRTYYYGGFSGQGGPNPRWTAFEYWPCVGQNYVGLRNRLTILSEAYSYLPFKRRIEVTEALVLETCNFMVAHGAEIDKVTKQADADAVKRGQSAQQLAFGVEFERKALPQPVEMLVGAVVPLRNPKNDRDMKAMVEDKVTPVKMPDFALWASKRTIPAAHAYLVQPDAGKAVIEKLRQHGVTVETLTAPLTTEVEAYAVETATKRNIGNKGTIVQLKGQTKKETVTFPIGAVVVRAAQPLGTLAAIMMEPEGDDGISAWGFLGDGVNNGKTHPIYKLMVPLKATTKVVD